MTDQQKAALEPCPFCGEEAFRHGLDESGFWVVGCVRHTLRMLTEAEAIAAWNTRPAPAGAEAVREALETARAELGCGSLSEAPAYVRRAYSILSSLAKAPSTGEGSVEANEIRHLKEQIRQMFITIDKQAAALAAPQPAPTAAEDGLREAFQSAWEDHLQFFQPDPVSYEDFKCGWKAALRAKPTAAEDGLREALEAKIASLEASIKGKEAIIYSLLTKGTNQ